MNPSKKYILPFYHTVCDVPLDHIRFLYPVKTVKRFKKDIEYFLKKYEPVDLETLYKHAQDGFKNVKKPILHLSFDDGHSELKSLVAPLLLQKGIPATFFVNPDFLSNKGLSFRYKASILMSEAGRHANKPQIKDILSAKYHEEFIIDALAEKLEVDFSEYLEKHKPYIHMRDLTELTKQGFTIGAHSMKHPEFQYLDEKEQVKQLKQSMKFVTKHFDPKIKAFAFPFTDFGVSQSFFDKVKEKSLVDITFGTAGIKDDQAEMNFQRIPMETNYNGHITVGKQKLKSMLRSMIGKNIIKRKNEGI
ncbi:polysaccharide deacetylase family protein [bacterium]|nr:polysaccharide deacetylase family protein [bacterium]